MIDWSAPQPSYEELHAKLDTIATERNAAIAEAKLWLRRLQDAQRERDEARADLAEAAKTIEQWETAYQNLRRDYWTLCAEHSDAKWWREHHEEMRRLEALPNA